MDSFYSGDIVNSIIGEGTSFRGDLDLKGLLRIDGNFNGTIHTKGKVFVGRSGKAEGSLHASTVVVGGLFQGHIHATDKVLLLASAVVVGTITSRRLVAEEGVYLTANLSITGANTVAIREKTGHRSQSEALFGRYLAISRDSQQADGRVFGNAERD